MHRFTGQQLPPSPKIALLANDALGNFAIATILAQMIRVQYSGCELHYFGGERTRELEEASVVDSLFDRRFTLLGKPFGNPEPDFDLVINIEVSEAHRKLAGSIAKEDGFVCGPAIANDAGEVDFPPDSVGDLWRDKRWVADDITLRYPFLQSGFIGEIFARLAYLNPIPGAPWTGGLPRYKFPTAAPSCAIPEILISTGASLPDKLWPVEKWRELLTNFKRSGATVGLLGAPPKRQREFYHSQDDETLLVDEGLVHDFRGRFTLPEVVGAIKLSKFVVTIDNGILHFAAANDKPTVGLFRPDIVRLWGPPNPNLIALTPDSGPVANISLGMVMAAMDHHFTAR